MRVTMLMPAMAASPKAPAATLSISVAILPSPCLDSEGVPPKIISLAKARVGVKLLRRMRMFSPLCVIQKSMAQPKHWLMRVATAAPVMPSWK